MKTIKSIMTKDYTHLKLKKYIIFIKIITSHKIYEITQQKIYLYNNNK